MSRICNQPFHVAMDGGEEGLPVAVRCGAEEGMEVVRCECEWHLEFGASWREE